MGHRKLNDVEIELAASKQLLIADSLTLAETDNEESRSPQTAPRRFDTVSPLRRKAQNPATGSSGFGNFYEILFSFYKRNSEVGISTREIESVISCCQNFKSATAATDVDRNFLWKELETGLCSQKFIRSVQSLRDWPVGSHKSLNKVLCAR